MSVAKHGNKYRVTYSWQGKTKHEYFDSEAIARARDDEIKAGKKAGTFVPPHELLDAEADPAAYGKGITVAEMMTILINDYGPRNWKPNVAASNAARIDTYIIPLIGDEKLSTLTPKRLERFFLEVRELPQMGNPNQKVGLSVVEKIKSLLSTAMKEAYRLQYITKREQVDVVSLAECDSYSSEERTIWTLEECLRAVEAAQPLQMRVWLKLAAQGTARIGENLGLKWDDVAFQPNGSAAITYRWQLQRIAREEMQGNQKIVVYETIPGVCTTKDKAAPQTVLCLCGMKSKGKKPPPPRTVYVGPNLAADLQRLKARQEGLKTAIGDKYADMGFVLAQDNGRPYEEHIIRKQLKQLCLDNGLPVITPHSMRHWSISLKLLLSHGDVKTVQADSGQKNTKMVIDRYSHAFEEERRKMAFAVEGSISRMAQNSQNIPKAETQKNAGQKP